jgi:hypothetical protein
MSVRSLIRSGLVNFVETRSMLVGNEAFSTTSYELIATNILASSEPTITFNNLSDYASQYKHLQIRMTTLHSAASQNAFMRINNDSGSNYAFHKLNGNGSNVVSFGAASQNIIQVGYATDSTTAANASIIDILDAYSTTKNKTSRILTGATNGNNIGLLSGLWINTQAINSITIGEIGGSFRAGSRFSIYGIKG